MDVVLVAYDSCWKENFELEAARIKKVFGDLLIELHHIGSTSVPGLHAKPIIDMLSVVHDLAGVDLLSDQMIELGYEPMGELGIAGRRYFYASRTCVPKHAKQPVSGVRTLCVI